MTLRGLSPGTAYHVRALSSTANGSAASNDLAFTTEGGGTGGGGSGGPKRLAVAITSPSAESLVDGDVNLSAEVTTDGSITCVWFEVDEREAASTKAIPFSVTATELAPGAYDLVVYARSAGSRSWMTAVRQIVVGDGNQEAGW